MDNELERLLPPFIIGAEGEDDSSGGDPAGDPTGGQEDPQDDPNASEEHDDDSPDDDDPLKGLKTGLNKERAKNKALERENRKLRAAQEQRELEEKTEIEQERIKREKAEAKAEKLAQGYRTRELNSAIEKAAQKLNFLDIDDAISGVDKESITIEQDDEDPSDVTVDLKAVEKAVKALAAKKPHFIRRGTTDGEPTGEQFGGSKSKKPETTEETFRKQYPGL